MEVEFLNPRHIKEKADVVVIPVYEGLRLGPIGQVTDTALEGYIKYNAQTTPSFDDGLQMSVALSSNSSAINRAVSKPVLSSSV